MSGEGEFQGSWRSRLYKGFPTVVGITIISRVAGFVRDTLIASVLGASHAADAFFVGFRLPNLFLQGAFETAFIPLFVRQLHAGGREQARSFAVSALSTLTTLLISFVLLVGLGMPWLMWLVAPGFSAEPAKFHLAILLAQIMFPFLVLASISSLYGGILSAFGRFEMYAFSPLLLNIVLIALLLAIRVLGVENQFAAEALAWGILASGMAQVLLLAAAVRRLGMRIAIQRPRLTPEIARLARLVAPSLIAGGMVQVGALVQIIIASTQDRLISWIHYADRLCQLPLGIIGVAMALFLLPDLSHKLRSGEREDAVASLNRAIELALLLTLPAMTALVLGAEPIVRILFERGAFSVKDTNAVCQFLAVLSFGLPALVLIKVLQANYFAREDTKTPMLYTGISTVAGVLMSFGLFAMIGGIGLAFATTLSGWLRAVLLILHVRSRGYVRFEPALCRRLGCIFVSSAIMGLVVLALLRVLSDWFNPNEGLAVQMAALFIINLSGLIAYLGTTWVAADIDLRDLVRWR